MAVGYLQEARNVFTTCSLSYKLLEDGQNLRTKYVGALINKQKNTLQQVGAKFLVIAQLDTQILFNVMYVCPCIIYEIDERYPLDATIYLLL